MESKYNGVFSIIMIQYSTCHMLKAYLLFLVVFSATPLVPTLNEQIAEQIFVEEAKYILYFRDQNNQNTLAIFQQFCQEHKLCVIVDPSVEEYESFKAFFGLDKEQFFAILEPSTQSKFALHIEDNFNLQTLKAFKANYEEGILEPLMASEPIPQNVNQKCRELVAKNLDEYLGLETPVKVIFLYTKNQACELCPQMLTVYEELAEHAYDPNIVAFGYYDMFLNDHDLMKDLALPHFLIFKRGEESYREVIGEDMPKLLNTIIEIVMEDSNMDPEELEKLMKKRGEWPEGSEDGYENTKEYYFNEEGEAEEVEQENDEL